MSDDVLLWSGTGHHPQDALMGNLVDACREALEGRP